MRINQYIIPTIFLCSSLLFLYQAVIEQQKKIELQESTYKIPVGTVDLKFDLAKSIEIKQEKDIQQLIKEPILRCLEDSSLDAAIAKRICTSEIKSFWGVKAIIVAFFMSDTGLTSVKVDIPNQYHDEAIKLLKSKYGPAKLFNDLGPQQRSMSWKVPGGIILFPPYASLKSDKWSSIIWLADSVMKKSKIGS